jgi:hypothetical protein
LHHRRWPMSSPHPVSVCPIGCPGPPSDTSWEVILEIGYAAEENAAHFLP